MCVYTQIPDYTVYTYFYSGDNGYYVTPWSISLSDHYN